MLPGLATKPFKQWQTVQALADQVIENIEAFIDGQQRNLVT
jgi:hypothetical protein